MTSTATTNSSPRLRRDDSNTWAVPWKLAVIVAGSMPRAIRFSSATASPSANPGRRLKEMVTEGSWPLWLMDSGPYPWLMRASTSRGTSAPEDERT